MAVSKPVRRHPDEKTVEASRPGNRIEFLKQTVIGSVIEDPHGDIDIMSAFFNAVEGDARDNMTSHREKSVGHYEFSDRIGKTSITVTHEPHGNIH